MTWKEIQLTALQKMFSAEGDGIPRSDPAVREYLAAMPQAANEAVQLLLAAGFAPRCSLRIEKTPGLARTVDLRTLAPDLHRADPLEAYTFDPAGTPQPVTGALLAAGRYLLLPAGLAGPVELWYEARPEPFSALTPEGAELKLPADAGRLLPLYIASQLYKDDDAALATQYRNEFEAALASLRPEQSGVQGGAFVSEKGWC